MTDDEWQADWETSRRAQLDSQMAATPAQRLAWLEDALRIAFAAGALPRESAPDDGLDGSLGRAKDASSDTAS